MHYVSVPIYYLCILLFSCFFVFLLFVFCLFFFLENSLVHLHVIWSKTYDFVELVVV